MPGNAKRILFHSQQRVQGKIYTYLLWDYKGSLYLFGGVKQSGKRVSRVLLSDLGFSEENCLKFTEILWESFTPPELFPELFEEYFS